ncbi:MAG: protein phosphatase 2C domain-containing protein [Archaeoglobaceae archaeon]
MQFVKREWFSKIKSFSGIRSFSNGELKSLTISLKIGFENKMHRIYISSIASNDESLRTIIETVLNSIKISLIRGNEPTLPENLEIDGFGNTAIITNNNIVYHTAGEVPEAPTISIEKLKIHQNSYKGQFLGGYVLLTPTHLVEIKKSGILEDYLEKLIKIPDVAFSAIGVNVKNLSSILKSRRAIFSIFDKGLFRENNEDSCLSSTIELSNNNMRTRYNVLCVADGVGGSNYGEIASRDAIIESYISTIIGILNHHPLEKIVYDAVISANNAVLKDKIELGEMGTTLTLGVLKKNDLAVGHVGDSRAYIINENEIKQITTDHKYVENLLRFGVIKKHEAKFHPSRNIITNALGLEKPKIDVILNRITEKDCILLATDGLTDLVDDSEIHSCFIEYPPHPELIGKLLVYMANIKGGKDNISLSLITPIV